MDTVVDNKFKYVILHSEGGHGKQVMATAVCRAIMKKYPDRKLIVVTAWDAPFYGNPDVWRVFTFGRMDYFFDDYVNEDTIILRHEVYHSEDHILQRKHLVDSWCGMYDIEPDGHDPKLYVNPREIEIARDKVRPDGRPIMLLQTHGGAPSAQYSKKSWFRDMPMDLAQRIVNYYKGTYRILHIRTEDQPALRDTEILNMPLRELYGVFPLSTKRIFIDSFAQHVAAGMGLQSTVVWIGNKPDVFGYDFHKNITPSSDMITEMNKFSYLDQFDISGNIQQFPYNTVNMIDINDVIRAVDEQA